MLITLKPHSTFSEFFTEKEYKVEVNNYYDIEFYLQGTHPRFKHYISKIKQGISNESFTYVTEDFKVIKRDEYTLKKIKEDSVIYIAPVVTGGGGRRGQLIAAIGLAVVGSYAAGGGALFGGPGFSFETLVANFGAGAATGGAGGSFLGNLGARLPGMLLSIAGNLALSVIQSLFISRPKGKDIEVAKDSGSRAENNIFGSLQNTTQPGTSVALNYGNMRVGGQFLSGYILSQQHAQNDTPSIASIFNSNESPLSAEARAEE
jgi:predicted phage tail protein